MSDTDDLGRDLVRFRRLVRSKIREHAARMKEPPGLTLWVSKGDRPGKCAPVRVGAARDAGDVAAKVRQAMIDSDCRFAAVGTLLHRGDGRTVTGRYGLVVAARDGLVESWQALFTAGQFEGWEEGTFDVGSSADLMRNAWTEAARRRRLRSLEQRLVAVVRAAQKDPGVDEEAYGALYGRVNELGEGLQALQGNPLAVAPAEPEGRFVAFVERWLEDREGGA